MHRKSVGIVVFDDIEVLDFCGPFEVFSVTRLDEAKRREEPSPFDVKLIPEKGGRSSPTEGCGWFPTTASTTARRSTSSASPAAGAPAGSWRTRSCWSGFARRAPQVELLTSVCTGAMLLGFAGLLEGRRATTHWRSLDWMAESFPRTEVVRDQHVVTDGTLISSAGISAGIDMALTVVARCHGEAIARATARQMEYPYPESNNRRIDF